MQHRHETTIFVAWFAVWSLLLGWLFWINTSAQIGVSMLAVPVASSMLAARGFSWKRKLVYAGATFGLYLLGNGVANATGLIDLATERLSSNPSFPPVQVVLYMAYLTTFPFAMLVLFVGRTPSLLWSKSTR